MLAPARRHRHEAARKVEPREKETEARKVEARRGREEEEMEARQEHRRRCDDHRGGGATREVVEVGSDGERRVAVAQKKKKYRVNKIVHDFGNVPKRSRKTLWPRFPTIEAMSIDLYEFRMFSFTRSSLHCDDHIQKKKHVCPKWLQLRDDSAAIYVNPYHISGGLT
ncbi:hypothetical protein LR48_Vigan05g092800 [Vigna angularis]|uniref:Uncharacterized protein n=1 Tax=Phaseolus angularis TaxID=3914 RepID=A0A0L9UL86_PHAAN|nr:hypothetical protein LR48_Vigan05g092800 [Vigna angularis]